MLGSSYVSPLKFISHNHQSLCPQLRESQLLLPFLKLFSRGARAGAIPSALTPPPPYDFALSVEIVEYDTTFQSLLIKIIRPELKTLEWDILNPDLLTYLEIKFMRKKSHI